MEMEHVEVCRGRQQPKRVRWLVLLCLFAGVTLLVLLWQSPVVHAALPKGWVPTEALDVPFIDQREKYPTGCESVTAVMALQYAGVDVTVEEFIDQYLPQGEAPHQDATGAVVGPSPWEMFLGSPYSEEGWGCYAPVIGEAVEQLLQDRGVEGLSVKELYGEDLPQLCEEYVSQGTPVMVWATIDMAEPTPANQYYLEGTGELFTWIYPLHCLLLTGEDGETYIFNDPMAGKNVAYPKEQVEEAFEGVGMQAVVLESTE